MNTPTVRELRGSSVQFADFQCERCPHDVFNVQIRSPVQLSDARLDAGRSPPPPLSWPVLRDTRAPVDSAGSHILLRLLHSSTRMSRPNSQRIDLIAPPVSATSGGHCDQ